jgi:hypothetical protein
MPAPQVILRSSIFFSSHSPIVEAGLEELFAVAVVDYNLFGLDPG